MHHGRSDLVQDATRVVPHSPFFEGPFGRLFRKLPPYIPPGQDEVAKLQQLETLSNVMSEPEPFDPGLDNRKIPSGYTYFGQFIDHDITFDPTSSLQRQNDPNRLVNFRSPRFDLDCIYGRGVDDQPYLYDQSSGGWQFLLGSNGGEDDLQRNSQGRALIGDPRNDENIIVSQFQLMFLKFHNRMMAEVPRGDLNEREHFERVQREVRWHYQWAVVHDFLPRIVGRKLWERIAPKKDDLGSPQLRFYKPHKNAFIPVEFSGAAYRLGHSMIRGAYHLNTPLKEARGGQPLPIFLPRSANPGPLDDLRGFRPLPTMWTIEWNRYFDFGAGELQPSRRIDIKLARALRAIPAGPGGENPLAILNLVRGWRLGLPSGQSVARALGITPINSDRHDPLWFYILNESAEDNGGEHVGPTGGNIVAEVFWGLLKADPLSWLNVQPDWTPWIGGNGKDLEIKDIIAISGAPIDTIDQPN